MNTPSTFRTQAPARTTGNRRARWVSAAALASAAMLTLTAAAVGPAGASTASAHPSGFHQVNLVSDIPGLAALTDLDLVNAWGLSASPGTDQSPGSPLWVSDNGTDLTTLYRAGTPTSVSKVPLVVTVTSGAPTGQVFNTDPTGFAIHDSSGVPHPATFLFDSENGGIDGWSRDIGGTVTQVAVANGANAVYKGLAIGQGSNGQ